MKMPPPGRGAARATPADKPEARTLLLAPAVDNPPVIRPTLSTAFERLLAGRWPGELRRLLRYEKPVPLAIGTTDAIVERAGLDAGEREVLARLMRCWCGTITYLEALAHPFSCRVGLDGVPVEAVSAEHRKGARERLRRKRARIRERMLAQEQDQEQAPAPADHRFPVLKLRRLAP